MKDTLTHIAHTSGQALSGIGGVEVADQLPVNETLKLTLQILVAAGALVKLLQPLFKRKKKEST